MARIAGVVLPRGKRAEIGLTYIYGIGPRVRTRCWHRAKIDPGRQDPGHEREEVSRIRTILEKRAALRAISQEVS